MAKPMGTVTVESRGEKIEVPAYKIGRYWTVNDFDWDCKTGYYSVTHIPTGRRIVGGIGYRRALKMVGVLDVLLPAATEEHLCRIWTHQLPAEVREALLAL